MLSLRHFSRRGCSRSDIFNEEEGCSLCDIYWSEMLLLSHFPEGTSDLSGILFEMFLAINVLIF